MSRRTLKSGDEQGFIRAIRDELTDTEAIYHVHIFTQLLRPLKGEGLDIRMYVYKRSQDPSEDPWIDERYPYPSHAANTLYAALYRACIRIGGAIANKRKDETGDWLRATD